MNERICKDFRFFNCTTAPVTGASSALATTPCTLRVVGSPFFFDCPKLAGMQRASVTGNLRYLALVLVGLIAALFLSQGIRR